jgi:hypothetical protein
LVGCLKSSLDYFDDAIRDKVAIEDTVWKVEEAPNRLHNTLMVQKKHFHEELCASPSNYLKGLKGEMSERELAEVKKNLHGFLEDEDSGAGRKENKRNSFFGEEIGPEAVRSGSERDPLQQCSVSSCQLSRKESRQGSR